VTRVLIVEDDYLNRMLTITTLKRCGYEVVEAYDGAQAMRRLEEQAIDLVLTDLLMPHTNGIVLVDWLRRVYPQIPVIAVSADQRSLTYVSNIGADALLLKPFNVQQFVQVIQQVVKKRAS
jgi:CheY-like chemotaxis protein